MRKLIFLLLSVALVSCQEKSKQKVEPKLNETEAFTQQFSISFSAISLDPEAQKIARNWAAYITAKNEINSLRKTSVNQIIANSGAISQIMQSLEKSLPDSLNSVPVRSRLRVLNTKGQVLAQKSNLQIPNPSEIRQVAEEIPIDFNNLNIQLNELFIESIEDFEAELDRAVKRNQEVQQRKRDSLENIPQQL